jgi:hypothetical protein
MVSQIPEIFKFPLDLTCSVVTKIAPLGSMYSFGNGNDVHNI